LKKLFERLPLPRDDRSKLLFAAAAAGIMLAVALVLPLLFRAPMPEPVASALTAEEKMLIFTDCVRMESGEEVERALKMEKLEAPESSTAVYCETMMRTLVARSIRDDAFSYEKPSGSEYVRVTDGEERELSLCRMWLESRGDWQNWLDVRFDAQTGMLYYYYLSRECLQNRENYAPDAEDTATAESVAEAMAVEAGWQLRWMETQPDGSAVALFSTQNGTASYRIACTVYDTLIDIHISCI